MAVDKNSISVLQGIVQAVSHMAERVGVAWIVAPFAFLLSVSIAGIGSAWLGGSARIPFVAGLDSYMPAWLGRIHPKYATPYAALIVHATVSLILVIVNFVATGGVQESFQSLLSLAVVLQLIPFLYMFGALLKIALDERFRSRPLCQGYAGFCGSERTGDHNSRHCIGFFPRAADQIHCPVRNLDVWRDAVVSSGSRHSSSLYMAAERRRESWQRVRQQCKNWKLGGA